VYFRLKFAPIVAHFFGIQRVSGKVKFAVASATNWSSIPEAQEGGGFDLAICVYVLCTLLSKEEVCSNLLVGILLYLDLFFYPSEEYIPCVQI